MAPSANLMDAESNRPRILVAQSLAAAATPLYTTPVDNSTVIGTVTVCNTSGVDRSAFVSVTRGLGGGTARLANIDLEPGESCVVDELVGFFLGPGDVISGWASAVSSVDIAISGAVSS